MRNIPPNVLKRTDLAIHPTPLRLLGLCSISYDSYSSYRSGLIISYQSLRLRGHHARRNTCLEREARMHVTIGAATA